MSCFHSEFVASGGALVVLVGEELKQAIVAICLSTFLNGKCSVLTLQPLATEAAADEGPHIVLGSRSPWLLGISTKITASKHK